MGIAFSAGLELALLRRLFGRRLFGRRGGGGGGGGRSRRAVSASGSAAVTAAHRPGTARGLARRHCRRGRRGRRGRRRRGRGGGRRGRGGRRQSQGGRELGLAVLVPGRVLARRYRVGRLLAAGLLQNGVQVHSPLVGRP